METKYDAVVIGSGLGGLSAGAVLARQGKKVLVLEKHYQVGGYATSFHRKDFTFDVALHQMSGVNRPVFKSILKKCGIYDKVEFIKHQYQYELLDNDGTFCVKNGDIEDLKKQLFAQFPKEILGIKLWFFIIKKIGKEDAFWEKTKTLPFLIFAPLFIPLLIICERISVQKMLIFCTKNKKLQTRLLPNIEYWGSNKSCTTSLLPFIAMFGYYFDGGYYVRGGGVSISLALRKVIEEQGGVVKTSTAVEKILVENNTAIGVETKQGERFLGTHIVANASPFVVYEKLLKNQKVAEKELKKISLLEVGMSVSQLYIGLDTTVDMLSKKFKDSYLVFINDTGDDFYKKIGFAFHANIEKTENSTHQKDTFVVIFNDNYERWDLPKEEYQKKKKIEIGKMISIVEKYIPTIKNHIEVIELGTPKTMERYTGNKKGALYGFSQKIGQSGLERFKNKSLIQNLYFASAWTFPGGGFEGAIRAGVNTANTILKKIK